MFELYSTVILAAFVWGAPLYKLIVKKEKLNQNSLLLAPIAYFAFYSVLIKLPVNHDMYIYEGFQDRLVLYFLMMHILVFVLVFVLESKNEEL